MELDIITYEELLDPSFNAKQIEKPLLNKGILGVSHIPQFELKYKKYINVARLFSQLNESIKKQYAPNLDSDSTGGYEIGVEWFKNEDGEWQVDAQKASYYACVPDNPLNIWPTEINLKKAYLELGELIFAIGKKLLTKLGLNEEIDLNHDLLRGFGRMLHYQRPTDLSEKKDNWCGAHYDHGLFTGLTPASYFKDNEEVEEPKEAGLYILPHNSQHFEKVEIPHQDILLFQVGEFAQLLSHDRFTATKHMVKRAPAGIERFTYALFFSPAEKMSIKSASLLTKDLRYSENQTAEGYLQYKDWDNASLKLYQAT
ncbi:2OG-Fe(II) oxygenase family protein [Legionella gresilensis]|uniref:2OG-Fe(II) oxygenase family protein n=1 Tax=Legionella gresilensis TaxID=91823 RepID=UPI0010416F49|nr:2OG-Fe(II) oxygenase family protein [Legionella gresilensis]